jgi:hypothetical protein
LSRAVILNPTSPCQTLHLAGLRPTLHLAGPHQAPRLAVQSLSSSAALGRALLLFLRRPFPPELLSENGAYPLQGAQTSAPVTAEQHRENVAYSLQGAQTPEPAEAGAAGEVAEPAEGPEGESRAVPLPRGAASTNSQ